MTIGAKGRLLVAVSCLAWAGGGGARIGRAAAPTAPEVCNHAVVLLYHHVAVDTPASTSLSPALFAAQLEYLAGGGHQVRALPAIVDSLRQGRRLPDLTVGLSFDDGYESVYTEAFPRLKARGWPFTVFVCPEAIDHRRGPVLGWDQLREMAAAGATIANHGLRHDHLQWRRDGESDKAWAERVRAELLTAQARIVEEIGTAPPLLAYPYGEYDPLLQELVAELGWTAFGQQSGALGETADFTLLPRFPMAGPYGALAGFGDKVRSLPLPVVALSPASPLIAQSAARPVLRVTLDPAAGKDWQLQAFASGQGDAEIIWIDRVAGVFEVRAYKPLQPGRSRYNITASHGESGRYHWFSQTWIIGNRLIGNRRGDLDENE